MTSFLLPAASVGVLITESYLARRFHGFDPSLPHSRAFFDRYFFWLVGLVILASFMLGSWFTKVFHLPTLSPSTGWWPAVGIGLIAAGYALRLYAMATLKRAFSFALRVEQDQSVVTMGPYRYVRHPSYTGGLVVLVGLGVLSGETAVIVLLGLGMMVMFLTRIRREESILRHLPAYPEYCTRTRSRLIPGIL
jgi:protein-S-isoprenylcysteine O-methyltransferase Ste14